MNISNLSNFKIGLIAIAFNLVVGFVFGMAYAGAGDNQKMTEARNLDQQIVHKISKICESKGQ